MPLEPLLAGQKVEGKDQSDDKLEDRAADAAHQRDNAAEQISHPIAEVGCRLLHQLRPVDLEGFYPLPDLGQGQLLRGNPRRQLFQHGLDAQHHHAEGLQKLGDNDPHQQSDHRQNDDQRADDAKGAAAPVAPRAGRLEKRQPFQPRHQDIEDVGNGAAEKKRHENGEQQPSAV